MSETIRLYDHAPYDTDFDAAVVSVVPGKKPGTVDIVLDATLFFPEEGGQTPDRGVLAGFPVVDVQISKDNIVTHTVCTETSEQGPASQLNSEGIGRSGAAVADMTFPSAEIPSVLQPGCRVHGTIDWEHRFSNMQNHSGEHILSGLLHNLYGYENVGFRLSDNTVTLDTSGHLSQEQILDLEMRANQVVWNNVPITCEYPSPEKLAAMTYRSKKELTGPVRIVTIEGVDVCACCAPHVRRTGEIGLIKILSSLREKDTTRFTIACGKRALLEVEHHQNQLEKASHLMNEPQATVSDGVSRLLNEISELKENSRKKEMQYIEAKLAQIRSDIGAASADAAGLTGSAEDIASKDIWLFESDLTNLSQRSFMNSLCEMGWRYAGVFVGNDEKGWNYLIGARGADARIPNKALRDHFAARGGGKPEMVQGTVHAEKAAIEGAMGAL